MKIISVMPKRSLSKEEDQPELKVFLTRKRSKCTEGSEQNSMTGKGQPGQSSKEVSKVLTSKTTPSKKPSKAENSTNSVNPKTRTPPSAEKRVDKKANHSDNMGSPEPLKASTKTPRTPPQTLKATLKTPPKKPTDPLTGKEVPKSPNKKIPEDPKIPKEPEDKMEAMENRLMTALKNLQDLVTPIQRDLRDLKSAFNEQSVKKEDLTKIQTEQHMLHQRVDKLGEAHKKMKSKMDMIEEQILETNLIFHGLAEEEWEKEVARQKKIHHAIQSTLSDEIEDKEDHSKTFEIVKSRRIGKYTENRVRPISVTFARKNQMEEILTNKRKLPDGIYIDKEYPEKIEKNRKKLRPILKAAKRLDKYKRKSKLEGDTLVLHGTKYNVNNLHTLPTELSCFKVSSKTKDEIIGFFGELNPFSNFYDSSFNYNGVKYNNSEQFIQHAKATYFEDEKTARDILCCNTPLEAKRLGKAVENFNIDDWKSQALNICLPGIKCKFNQNEDLWNLLQSTGSKTLVESSLDNFWGTGIPLYRSDSLDKEQWKSVGLLGKILVSIRSRYQRLIRLVI